MKAITFNSTVTRIFAAVVVLAAIIFAAASVIWTVANTSASAADQKEVAVLLTELSPGDAQTHLASAILHEKSFEAADLEIALTEYEKAAAASPNNYLFWLLLGSARARAGDIERSEVAFRRANALAPNYSWVQWALGNLLFRQGRADEGYRELRKAVEGDPSLSAPAVSISLQLSDGNALYVQEKFKGLAEVQIRLALVLVEQKRFDEANAVWKSVEISQDSERLKATAKQLKQKLLESKQFRFAAQLAAATAEAGEAPVIGMITNPGFEQPVRSQNAGEFDWRVPQSNFPQFAITDAQKLSGQYSLFTVLNSSEAKDFQGIAQTVAVEPGRSYELSIGYRSDLKSKAAYLWEIRSAVDSKPIAVFAPLPLQAEWTTLKVAFTVPAEIDGVEIRLVRGPCTASACAATGSFWFDDVVLTAK